MDIVADTLLQSIIHSAELTLKFKNGKILLIDSN